jgi:hypothetical protein
MNDMIPDGQKAQNAALRDQIASMSDEQKVAYVEMIYAKMEAEENVLGEESKLFLAIMIGGISHD